MKSFRKSKKNLKQHLQRIERKCDRILAEILILRKYYQSQSEIDIAIDKLHRVAKKFRDQCKNERDIIITNP